MGVGFVGCVEVVLEELGLGSGAGAGVDEGGFETVAIGFREVLITGFTQVFEGFAASFPAVSFFVVFPGVAPLDFGPARDTGDRVTAQGHMRGFELIVLDGLAVLRQTIGEPPLFRRESEEGYGGCIAASSEE